MPSGSVKFGVKPVRDGDWWVLHVRDVGATRVRDLADAESHVRDYLGATLDVDPTRFEIVLEDS